MYDLNEVKNQILQNVAQDVTNVSWMRVAQLAMHAATITGEMPQMAAPARMIVPAKPDRVKWLVDKCNSIDCRGFSKLDTLDKLKQWADSMPMAKIGHTFHNFESREAWEAFFVEVSNNAEAILKYKKHTVKSPEERCSINQQFNK